MTNFDFLQQDPQFEAFAGAAVSAERIYGIDAEASVIGCRRAMEFAAKWMYSVDGALTPPYQDTLVSLMGTEEFRDIVGPDLLMIVTGGEMAYTREDGVKILPLGTLRD